MQDKESKGPVEAQDFSVDENENPLQEAEETVPLNEGREADAENGDDGNDETDKLKAELAEQKEKYIRLFAEFDNYKRRTSKEAIELRQTAGKEVIFSLLDVLDDMDRAEQQLQESDMDETLKKGVLLVFDKFRKSLQSKGL